MILKNPVITHPRSSPRFDVYACQIISSTLSSGDFLEILISVTDSSDTITLYSIGYVRSFNGMRVVGKGSWKGREVGKFEVGKLR